MKKIFAVVAAVLLAGCAHFQGVQKSGTQVIALDTKTGLAVAVDGVLTRATPIVRQALNGTEPIHRVLQGGDGNFLFAYDIDVTKASSAGAYQLRLKPARSGATFATVREVTVRGKDTVRVELMEQPETGRKVEDVFSLVALEENTADPGTHLNHIHAFFRNLFHGD